MQLVTWMQPRHHGTAARTVALLCGVAVIVTVVTFPLLREEDAQSNPVLAAAAAVSFALVVLVTVSVRLLDEAARVAWAVCPLLAVVCIVLVDLATHDATIRAQIFFVFSTLYAGANLSRPGAILMTTWSVLGEATVVFVLLPFQDALSNLIYVGAALVTASVLLVRFAERQDALVAVLEQRAMTDSLTGLVTRRVFDDATAVALVDPGNAEGTALILLDVDRFKTINDEFGHPGGDDVLVQLSDLLVATSRRGDVVCRLGGDEMAVLMPRCSVAVARRRAEQIVGAVRDHGFSIGLRNGVRLSVSAGVAHAPTHADTAKALYAAADAALYRAKRAGRDRVVAHGA